MYIEEHKIEILMIIFSSMATIIALIISFIYPKIQILTLTILTIILPLIYQIGHIYSKESIREESNKDYSIIEESDLEKDDYIQELEDENDNLVEYIDELENRK